MLAVHSAAAAAVLAALSTLTGLVLTALMLLTGLALAALLLLAGFVLAPLCCGLFCCCCLRGSCFLFAIGAWSVVFRKPPRRPMTTRNFASRFLIPMPLGR